MSEAVDVHAVLLGSRCRMLKGRGRWRQLARVEGEMAGVARSHAALAGRYRSTRNADADLPGWGDRRSSIFRTLEAGVLPGVGRITRH
jgi:hypothetical protein